MNKKNSRSSQSHWCGKWKKASERKFSIGNAKQSNCVYEGTNHVSMLEFRSATITNTRLVDIHLQRHTLTYSQCSTLASPLEYSKSGKNDERTILTELTNLPQLQQFNFPTAFSVFIVLFFFIYVLLFSDLYIPSTIHSIRENHERIELFAHKTVPVSLGHFVWDVYALCIVHIVDCLNRWLVHSNTHTHTYRQTNSICLFIYLSITE